MEMASSNSPSASSFMAVRRRTRALPGNLAVSRARTSCSLRATISPRVSQAAPCIHHSGEEVATYVGEGEVVGVKCRYKELLLHSPRCGTNVNAWLEL
jgi:hypothetical protein